MFIMSSPSSKYTSVVMINSDNVECNGSGVELRTLDYDNPGLNPVPRC